MNGLDSAIIATSSLYRWRDETGDIRPRSWDSAPIVVGLWDTQAVAAKSANLREAVRAVVLGLHSYSNTDLTALGASLGLPMPEQDVRSKSQRLEACLDALGDDHLLPVAENLLASPQVAPRGEERFALEDAVWAAGPVVELTARTRRELADALDLYDLIHRWELFESLLDQFWVLDNDPMAGWTSSSTTSRRAHLHQHVFNNPDWSTLELFEQLGAINADSARFGRFLEGLVNPVTLPDEAAQLRAVEAANAVLAGAGARLEQTDESDGYPCFQLVRTGPGGARRPKTLIFATTEKPDIRFVSVLDNDIEVLQDIDKWLIYDRVVGRSGLRWQELLDWWKDLTGVSEEKAAMDALFKRVLASMPSDDESPQREVYRAYHAIFKEQGRGLPVLLPEVWLHWDPKTVKQRGVQALLNHRMDFLLLMPNGHRVVVEVDGAHHYATGKAYADTVRGDRELKLRGYDVYRFSVQELHPSKLAALIGRFFSDLFEHYGVAIADSPSPAEDQETPGGRNPGE